MRPAALIIANQNLRTINGKTAHGLLRKSERYDIVGVLDPDHAGDETGPFVAKAKSVPIFADVTSAVSQLECPIRYCITGLATHGGRFPDEILQVFVDSLRAGISLVNGLHEQLSSHPKLVSLANEQGLELIDIRRSKTLDELHFWEGDIVSYDTPTIAVLGTDCALGKRTTTQWIVEDLRRESVNAHMIYTGQTGWLQGADYGFVFDVTPNDFVSGELEHACIQCIKNENPDLLVIEGQSSLRNPSGPCGAEFILSGQARGIILQHSPTREFYDGYEEHGLKIPPLRDEIQLIESYGAEVLAISLNAEGFSEEEAETWCLKVSNDVERPTFSFLHQPLSPLTEIIRKWAKR